MSTEGRRFFFFFPATQLKANFFARIRNPILEKGGGEGRREADVCLQIRQKRDKLARLLYVICTQRAKQAGRRMRRGLGKIKHVFFSRAVMTSEKLDQDGRARTKLYMQNIYYILVYEQAISF